MFKGLLEGVSGYVVTASIRVYPLESDVILPPFSSRILKSIVYTDPSFGFFRRLYESSESFKPVTFRTLRRGLRRLYSVNNGSPLVARSGEVLVGEIVGFTRDVSGLDDLLSGGSSGVLEFNWGKLGYQVDNVVVEDISGLTAGLLESDVFWVKIHTPLLVSTKTMTPPFALKSRFVESLPKAQRLLPSPAYLCCEAARLWLGVARSERAESHIPYYVGRACDVMLAEIDYKLRPVTAVYGREDGKIVKARGPVGYIGFKILTDKIALVLDKLLALASRMGLGKSRSMGFGEIQVIPGGAGDRGE